ncbi:MAG: carbon monoxide dehydrogenase subunit G [Alphaproteobacteria bacterium]|nr:carbon monoxide dehydrogenase subunit G [Alphaproteobacteria bacterium]
MEFKGQYNIPAPPDEVWRALNDPNVLQASIPGCQSLVRLGPTEFEASALVHIGPLRATFRGKVSLSDLDPPRRYRITGEGQGGAAGFAGGEAEVALTKTQDGTAIVYAARANVGGKLAQVGQRLIDGAARQIADEFFQRFIKQVTPAATAEPARERKTERRIWIIAVIAAVIAVILALMGS